MLSDMLLYLVCKDLLTFDLMKIVSWKLPHYYGTLSFFILAFHTIIHELMLIDGDMYKFCNVTEKQFAFDGNRQVALSPRNLYVLKLLRIWSKIWTKW